MISIPAVSMTPGAPAGGAPEAATGEAGMEAPEGGAGGGRGRGGGPAGEAEGESVLDAPEGGPARSRARGGGHHDEVQSPTWPARTGCCPTGRRGITWPAARLCPGVRRARPVPGRAAPEAGDAPAELHREG